MSATIKLPKITKIPEKGRTLAFACYSGNVQLAEEILENDPGMVLEEDPSSGATPLHYSLARSSLRTAQLLVEQPLLDEYKKYKAQKHISVLCLQTIYNTTSLFAYYLILRFTIS